MIERWDWAVTRGWSIGPFAYTFDKGTHERRFWIGLAWIGWGRS